MGNRLKFYWNHLGYWRVSILGFCAVMSKLGDFLPESVRNGVYGFIPHWPWYLWIILLLICLVVFLFEEAYYLDAAKISTAKGEQPPRRNNTVPTGVMILIILMAVASDVYSYVKKPQQIVAFETPVPHPNEPPKLTPIPNPLSHIPLKPKATPSIHPSPGSNPQQALVPVTPPAAQVQVAPQFGCTDCNQAGANYGTQVKYGALQPPPDLMNYSSVSLAPMLRGQVEQSTEFLSNPGAMATFYMAEAFVNPAFTVECDRPCVITGGTLADEMVEVPPIIGTGRLNPNLNLINLRAQAAQTKDAIEIVVRSKDSREIKILKVTGYIEPVGH